MNEIVNAFIELYGTESNTQLSNWQDALDKFTAGWNTAINSNHAAAKSHE